MHDDFEKRLAQRQADFGEEYKAELERRDAAARKVREELEAKIKAREDELAQLVARNEQRVAETKQRAIARMRQLEVAKAFTTWQLYASEIAELERAMSRLTNPTPLTAAYNIWRRLAEARAIEAEARAAALQKEKQLEKRLALARSESEALLLQRDAEAERRIAEMEAKLEVAEQGRKTAEEKHIEAVAKAREQAARRFILQDLARALNTWAAGATGPRKLRRALARMRSPGLASAFAHWRDLCAAQRDALAAERDRAATEEEHRNELKRRETALRSESQMAAC